MSISLSVLSFLMKDKNYKCNSKDLFSIMVTF